MNSDQSKLHFNNTKISRKATEVTIKFSHQRIPNALINSCWTEYHFVQHFTCLKFSRFFETRTWSIRFNFINWPFNEKYAYRKNTTRNKNKQKSVRQIKSVCTNFIFILIIVIIVSVFLKGFINPLKAFLLFSIAFTLYFYDITTLFTNRSKLHQNNSHKLFQK